MTSWAQVQGDTSSCSSTLSTCTIPPYLIMLWLQWSFHLNVPQKNLEKTASLWKNDNWLLCFSGSVCCCSLFFSMFSLFCCHPDSNENVLWDLNQFWMNADSSAARWSTSPQYLSWTGSGRLCLCKNQLCKNFRAKFNTAYLFWALQDYPPGTARRPTCSLFIGPYCLIWGTNCKLPSLTYNTVQWFVIAEHLQVPLIDVFVLFSRSDQMLFLRNGEKLHASTHVSS